MASLSTHVLDLVSGKPAHGVAIVLYHGSDILFSGVTNADGRCPEISAVGTLSPGAYRLEFAVADYFRGNSVVLSDPPFLDIVPISFGIAAARDDGSGRHYHVPLLVSPYGFSTYRGS